jgi:rhamnosyltransferase subunit B
MISTTAMTGSEPEPTGGGPRSPLEIFMFALGSGGDVYPTLGIGRALSARGHRVRVAANPYFEASVANTGVQFLPIGNAEDYRRRIDDPTLWRLGKGFKVLFREMLDNTRPVYDTIASQWTQGRTVVVAPTAALGARLANEKLGVPLANVQLQPLAFRSLHEQPGLRVPDALRPVLPSLRRAWLAALDKWVLDAELLPGLNAIRADLGLPPVRRVFNQWIYSPNLILGLFPDWFARPQPDWPPQARLTGFPLFADGDEALPADLQRFLDSGEPPIVFTLGTAMRFAATFFEVSVEVCRILKRRGLLLTKFANQVPSGLPENVKHVEFVALGTLLPRCAALVHHGGIGTLAQGLRAGIPQLVTPMNFDQPDNALRLSQLGVADRLRLSAYKPDPAARKLAALLGSPEIAARCRTIARSIDTVDSVTATCQLIESVIPPDSGPSTPV